MSTGDAVSGADQPTVVLPRSVRSSSSSSSFFDRTYMADPDELAKVDQFESTNYHVAFVRWTFFFALSLVLSDALVAVTAALIVSACFSTEFAAIDHVGIVHYVSAPVLMVLCVVVWVFSLWAVGCYHRHLMGEGYDLYAKIVSAAFVAVLFVGAACLLLRLQLPRRQIFWIVVLLPLLTCFERWIWRRIVHAMRVRGRMRYPVTLVGSWGGVTNALADIRSNVGLGYKVIAVAPITRDGDGAPRADQSAVTGTRHNAWARANHLRLLAFDSHLPATARQLGSQVVLLTDGIDRGSREYAAFSLAVQASGMELSIPVATTGDINGGFMFYLHNTADTMPVLTSGLPQFRWFRQLTKRVFDLLLSIVALVLAAIPMAVIALAIKHDDGGPVFYTQTRIGQYGKPFTLYKFRSMRVNADQLDRQLARDRGMSHGVTFKVKDDPRITKIGHFIRKTSLDELPQLFNVLFGQMSFVGPRPQQAYERDQYNGVYATRLLVKPGLTGPWQISGRSNLSPEQGEQLDVWYVTNNSFAGDVAILLKTIPAVLKGTGAY